MWRSLDPLGVGINVKAGAAQGCGQGDAGGLCGANGEFGGR
jgi:hypothetical protein